MTSAATPISGRQMAVPAGFTGLLLATPAYGGMLHHAYVRSLIGTTLLLSHLGIDNDFLLMVNESLIPRARDWIADLFLASRFSHMLCIDADIEWRPEDVLLLLRDACSHDLVMGAYRRKREPSDWPILWIDGGKGNLKVDQCSNCVEIGGGPAGFLMVGKLVFKRIAALHPELNYRTDDHSDARRTAFYNPFQEGDYLWSEDLAFCRRWCLAGGSVWLDPRIDLKHHGQAVFAGHTMDLFKTEQHASETATSGAA